MKKFNLIVCFILLHFANLAQVQTIQIWSGKIPGAIANTDIQPIIDSANNWIKMRNVINPVMDMYPASEKLRNGTAVLICPGGGYWSLAVKHEGMETAKWLNTLGITAFVLKYRLPLDAIMENKSVAPLQDAQAAIRLIRKNAKLWNVNPSKTGVMGYSAGGHLAASLSTHYNDSLYSYTDTLSARPDFSILIYPVITMQYPLTHQGSRENLLGSHPEEKIVTFFSNELQVNQYTPPAFLVHSLDDGSVSPENSIRYMMAMKQNKIPCELHLYQSGGHGYGLGRTQNSESGWPDNCRKWMQSNGLIP